MFGDSISAAYGIQREDGWVALLEERLDGSVKVVNASISGETTSGGRARLARAIEEHSPGVVIVELGGNDGLRGYPIADIQENLLAMAELAIDEDARVIIVGMQIPPNYGPRYTSEFRQVFVDVAEETRSELVPFLLEGVATDRNLMQSDGIHPTAAAQGMLLDNLWPVLQGVLESQTPVSQ